MATAEAKSSLIPEGLSSESNINVCPAESKYFADRVYEVYSTVYMAVHRLYMLCGERAQMQPMHVVENRQHFPILSVKETQTSFLDHL